MNSPSPIRVAVIDDQPMVRAGFAALLNAQSDMRVVGLGADGSQAITIAQSDHPDVILMDIRMPGVDGLTAMEHIFRECEAEPGCHRPRIIILTTFDADEYVFTALSGGASGFLLKDAEVDELVGAVRTVYRGGALLSPAITKTVIENFASTGRGNRQPSEDLTAQIESLTDRETEVARLIAQGLSNSEVGAQMYLAEPTVKTHVSHILQKLELRDRTQIVVAAYESGLVEVGHTS